MSSIGRGKGELYSSWWYVAYSSLVADKTLTTDGPGGAANGLPCRRIIPGTSGNLVVVRPDGTSVTLPVFAGQVLDIQATTITAAGTTVTSAIVCW